MKGSFFRSRFFAILLVIGLASMLLMGASFWNGAGGGKVYADNIDSTVYQGFEARSDGEITFVVYMKAHADLAPAHRMSDWDARGRFVMEQLQKTANSSQADLLGKLANKAIPGQISHYRSFWIANVIYVTGDRVAAEAIARHPDVDRILPAAKVYPPEPPQEVSAEAPLLDFSWGIEKIGADQVWSTYGFKGQGIVAGLVDTGVQWDHPALKDQYRGWDGSTADHNYNWYDPAHLCSKPDVPCDDNGHGTHTTGTVAGGDSGNALYGDIGVAPEAKWIHALGCCPDSETLMAAMQWMLAPTDLNGDNPDSSKRPQVVNNSWGGPGGRTYYEDAVESWRAAGIVPVFSAGNEGSDCGTMGSPGDNVPSYSVGATDSGDAIASFSSRGPNPFTGRPGPEVSAPGVSIGSSYPTDSYTVMSGTSMAAPHVTGAVAVLLSAEPALIGQVDMIEEIFRATAVQLTSSQTCGGVSGSEIPNNAFGWGRINLLAAVEAAMDAGTISGTVTDAGTGNPIEGAKVYITGNGHTFMQRTDDTGAYTFIIGNGSYDIHAEAFGYADSTAASITVTEDGTTTQNIPLTALATDAVSGVVTENSATTPAIEGASVELVEDFTTYITDTTTATGDYLLANVPHGNRELQVSAPGHAKAKTTVSVSGPTTQNFSLDPAPDYQLGDGGDTCSTEYSWIDASDGTSHDLDDDASKKVTLPFSFSFYGNSYSDVYVSSNGFVSFGAGYDRIHGIVPFEGPPNNAVYALALDLNPENNQGAIYTKNLGDGRFVIEYDQVQHWPDGDPETFEIILDNNDGTITVQYSSLSDPATALVGIENSDGSSGFTYSKAVTDGLALKYTPFSGMPPSCDPAVAPNPVTIEKSGTSDAQLRWQHVDPNAAYEIWRDTAPYFDPAAGEGTLRSTEQAVPGEMTYLDTGAVGSWDENHFYVIRGYLNGGVSDPSNRVGEFDFQLIPGTN